MGKPNVDMFEEGKLRKGQPNSNEEVKVGEKTKRRLDKPSSHKDKNILDDQLVMDQPNSTENMKVESRKKKKENNM